MILIRNIIIGILSFLTGAAFAQQNMFNPDDDCTIILSSENVFDDKRNALWSYGYVFAKSGVNLPYEKSQITQINNELTKLCSRNPTKSFSSILDEYIASLVAEQHIAVQGQKMLEDFLASGGSLAQFIESLKPRAEDIHAVYKEPLASNLVILYEEMYKSISNLRMFPEHNAVISDFSTTMKLKNDEAELKKFPKGFAKVLDYFAGDFPIATFKFVKLGEDMGSSFSGLVYVNNRWVLMPKPWRGLNDE